MRTTSQKRTPKTLATKLVRFCLDLCRPNDPWACLKGLVNSFSDWRLEFKGHSYAR